MKPILPTVPGIFAGLLIVAAATSPAAATQVIANWDVVPFQRLTEPTKIGVVAFHETGANVTFRVNGNVVATIADPTHNDETNVVEYWFELDPADYATGAITLDATAAPDGTGHDSRTLATITMYADATSSLGSSSTIWVAPTGNDTTGNGTETNPYATIKKGYAAAGDGGTVYLKAGNYTLASMATGSRSYWSTIQAAPGLDADDVQILTAGAGSTNRYGAHKVRWHNVSLYCQRGSTAYGTLFYMNSGQQVWFDGAVLYDANGPHANTDMFGGSGYSTWQTSGVVRDITNCNGGFRRNMRLERIGSDVFDGGTLTAINVTVDTVDRGTTSYHPDFIQFYRPGGLMENCILYNVRAYNMKAQGLFGSDGTAEDVAFVNLLLEQPSGGGYRSQLTGTWRHALLWNTTIVGQIFDFRTSADIQDFDVRNCVFSLFTTDNPTHPSITIDSVHTIGFVAGQTTALGTNATTGNALFVNAANDDYHLTAASPAYGNGAVTPGVPADIDGAPYGPTPNRGAFSAGVQLLGETTGGSVKLIIGDHTSGGNWCVGRSSTWATSSVPATTGTTTLLVARLQFVTGNGNDQVDLWVNPPLGATPPTTPDATLTGLDIGSFDRVDIKGNRTSTIDELTFGESWGSVIGQ